MMTSMPFKDVGGWRNRWIWERPCPVIKISYICISYYKNLLQKKTSIIFMILGSRHMVAG